MHACYSEASRKYQQNKLHQDLLSVTLGELHTRVKHISMGILVGNTNLAMYGSFHSWPYEWNSVISSCFRKWEAQRPANPGITENTTVMLPTEGRSTFHPRDNTSVN